MCGAWAPLARLCHTHRGWGNCGGHAEKNKPCKPQDRKHAVARRSTSSEQEDSHFGSLGSGLTGILSPKVHSLIAK